MNNTETLLKELIHILDQNPTPSKSQSAIPVGISNRHIHLSQTDIERLFGTGYQLSKQKDLKQPGQYAAKETLTIVGPKGSLNNVRVLGPARSSSQIEISGADNFVLGINAPIRESGDTKDSATLTVIGPKGSLELKSQVIVAKRHIHMTPADAIRLGVKDKEVVWIKTTGKQRAAILGDVVIRVSDSFSLECHLDMDEANAVAVKNNDVIEIYRLNE